MGVEIYDNFSVHYLHLWLIDYETVEIDIL